MPTINTRPHGGRAWFPASYDYRYVGLAVQCTETSPDVWSITAFPGVQMTEGDVFPDFTFHGTEMYTVTGSLADALNAAGYSVMPSFSSGFSGGFEIAI